MRNLEREIGAIARKLARRIAEDGVVEPIRVAPDDLAALLGQVKFEPEVAERVASRASRWGSPGRRRAATSCSSRAPTCPARAS